MRKYYSYLCTQNLKILDYLMIKENRWCLLTLLFLLGGAMSSLRAVAAPADYSPSIVDGVWQISTVEDLYAFAEHVNVNGGGENVNAKLMNDIVVNEQVFKDNNYTLVDNVSELRTWTPISGSIGTFDGQGYTISGLYLDESPETDTSSGYFGFFGILDAGTITNLGIINSYFCGFGYIGSLVAFVGFEVNNSVSITNCWGLGNYLVGHRHRFLFVGGIVGRYNCSRTITNCGFVGKLDDLGIADRIEAGGITGVTSSQIINCYSDVYTDLSSTDYTRIGRLIGSFGTNEVPFVNCYATIQGEAAKESRLCYYRYYTYNNPEGSVRTKEEFASGLVAYLLNGSESGKTDRWRQRIDGEDNQKDAYPVLRAADNNVVYAGTVECPNNELVLGNSEVAPNPHNYQVDNAQSSKISVPLYEMHCANGGCGKEKPNALVVKQWNGTDNLELSYELVESSSDDRSLYPITISSESKQCVFHTATEDLTINSENKYYSPVDFLVHGTLTFSRTFVPNTGCYTMFLPFMLTASEHTSLGGFYTCSGLRHKSDNNYSLDFNAISNSNDIAAHTGCLFLPKEANGTIPGINVRERVVKASTGISNPNSTSDKTNYTMYGTYQLTDIPTNVFGYYEKNGKAVFALGGSSAKLKQFRAYLYLEDFASMAREIPVIFVDEETTSVDEVLVRPLFDANTPVYDLFGRRVTNPQRGGIYIQNGKKIKM